MTPFEIGLIGIGVLLVLLFSNMPIGFVMAFVGFAGTVYLSGTNAGLTMLKTVPYSTFANYDLSVIPLFILMGAFFFAAELSKDLYTAAYKWIGHLPGGVGMATIVASAIFSSISGSSMVCAATFAKVALPELKRYNYDPALATGSIAAGGTLDILIPPAVMMIIYAIITENSIGKLFMAGFVPGILEGIFYLIVIYILVKRNSLLTGPRARGTTLKEKLFAIKGVWPTLLLFVVVIGGLYLGVFTPTEGAGIGAFGAFIFGIIFRRLSWKGFTSSLLDTGQTAAMIFVIIMGAMFFNYFLAVSRVPFELATLITSLEVNRYLILAVILVLYIILGALMDELAMVLLTVPIFYPAMMALGFDPIWFGIIIMMMCVFGMIAPPVGIIVFIISGVAKDIPMFTIYRGVIPFFIVDMLLVVLLIVFPQIVTFLPNLIK